MGIKLNNLNSMYTKLLNSFDVTANDNHELSQTIDSVETKINVAGRQLYLPHKDIVDNHSEDMVVFHPLSENILLGESPVLQETRALMMDFLSQRILDIIDGLLKIAIDKDLVATLSPTQIEALKPASGVDETSIKNWQSIMRRAESRGSAKRVMTIFLKRGTSLNDVQYKRAAIVNFNLYQNLTEGSLNVFGVKIRKADLNLYAKMFEAVIKDVGITDKYSEGSDSMVAPYFDCLVKAYAGVLKSINSIAWTFRKPLKEVKGMDLHNKDEFSELLTDLNPYRDILPSLPYNEGDRAAKREEYAAKTNPAAQPAEEAPKPQPLPASEVSGVTTLGQQSHDYYAYQPPQPVQQQLNQVPVQQPVQQQPVAQPTQHVSQAFPSIEQQLAFTGQQQNPFASLHTQMYPQQMYMQQQGFPFPSAPVVPQQMQQWGQPQQPFFHAQPAGFPFRV